MRHSAMARQVCVMDAKPKADYIDVRENGTKHSQKPEGPALSPLAASRLCKCHTHNCMRNRRRHKIPGVNTKVTKFIRRPRRQAVASSWSAALSAARVRVARGDRSLGTPGTEPKN